jgi:hypothetical protein
VPVGTSRIIQDWERIHMSSLQGEGEEGGIMGKARRNEYPTM